MTSFILCWLKTAIIFRAGCFEFCFFIIAMQKNPWKGMSHLHWETLHKEMTAFTLNDIVYYYKDIFNRYQFLNKIFG